ncbi:hypothetical protein [Streptomyces sp. NPDC007883]|uniref:hypothetical protein n=1 Tax=Streptomyces sp. NPDC007883 TaxID=3155116 RepID=UPI0033F7EFA6
MGALVDIVLDPHRGAGPVRLGMSLDEAVAAVSPRGAHEVEHDGDGKTIRTPCGNVRVNVVLEEAGEAVTAVELWWPGEGREADVRVLLGDDDVFTTPAEELFRRAAERGWTVDTSEAEHPFRPRCLPRLHPRRTTQEVPRTAQGLPVHVTSVLVAGGHYCDFRLVDH